MGLFTYTVAGAAVTAIGAWESLYPAPDPPGPNATPSSPSLASPPPENGKKAASTASFSSTVILLSISVLSVLFILNSFISLHDAVGSRDTVGFAIQLQVIAVASLFLLYSVLGVLVSISDSFRFPLQLLNLIYAFAFGEEFLLFYSQNKDPSGIENRYYDLILVPVSICLFSTLLELKNPKSTYPRLGRGLGMALQGVWTLQMGFSFYSNLIANGCSLHQRSRGNFTIKCQGHPEYHRGRAIATLQFNCYLALFVTLAVGLYSVLYKKYGAGRDFMPYKPIGVQMDGQSQFTLDSDDEDDQDVVKDGRSLEMQSVIHEPTVNGYGSHA
ncbi:Family of unknown function (DUF716 [Striga hermonthica]|uniref:Uncharacterized protein n=1 Tax=Striga hermonthica TaxID=68872 RepID=A0A9N7RC29_STRHE|nr:Family of unknown function (DUF716 [Striga hermonthica]